MIKDTSKRNILITSMMGKDGEFHSDPQLEPILNELCKQTHFDVYTTFWNNFLPDGSVRDVHHINTNSHFERIKINGNFELIHIYKLGRIYDTQLQLQEVITYLHENFEGHLINPGETGENTCHDPSPPLLQYLL